jgi:hypothetical protein
MMSSCHSSGFSRMKRAIKAMQSASSATMTSTPRPRRKSTLPAKFRSSPTTTRGIANCTMVPAHIMHGESEV